MMTVLWSSLLILVFYLLRTRFNLLELYSVSGVMVLYFFCILRTILPFELPYTRVVQGGELYNNFYEWINFSFVDIGKCAITIKHIFCVIWIVGSAYLLIKNVRQHIYVYHLLEACPEEKEEIVVKVKQEILSTYLNVDVKIVRFSDINTPYCAGMRKRYILLPMKSYTEKQLYYILMHECTHIKNQDVIIKNLIHVFCMLYWWNPIVYLLKKDFFQSIEIRCDGMVVAGISRKEKGEYLKTILDEFKHVVDMERYSDMFIPLGDNTEENVLERFQLVENGKNKSVFRGKILAWVFGILLLLISYSVVIQTRFDAPENDIEVEDMNQLDNRDSYIIKHKDGTYELVFPDNTVKVETGTVTQLIKDGFEIREEEKK